MTNNTTTLTNNSPSTENNQPQPRPDEWQAEVIISIDEATKLIESQFTNFKVSSIKRFGEGWDNIVYQVNNKWLFRFPRRTFSIAGINNEIKILPILARILPVPIPTPKYIGKIPDQQDWPFFGYKKLTGKESCAAKLTLEQKEHLIPTIANFLRLLHSPDHFQRWQHDFVIDPLGRADVTKRIPKTIELLIEIKDLGIIDNIDALMKIVSSVGILRSNCTALVHGDFHFRHLLINKQGALSGVIDWGDIQISDIAIDLQFMWTFFPPHLRKKFIDQYGSITDTQLMIARVLSIFISAILAKYGHKTGHHFVKQEALQGLSYAAQDL